MKRLMFAAMLTVAVPTCIGWLSASALAADETDELKIKIQSSIDAVNCAVSSPTITVLGLTIDVSAAAIGAQDSNSPGDQGDLQNNENGTNGEDGETQNTGGCADVAVGQPVEVQLANDATPLKATAVDHSGGDNGVTVHGPLQAIDATRKTVTVLGLTIDVSQARMDGANDDSQDGTSSPIDLSMLMVGQFAEVHLVSAQPPLTASELQVKNFANQIEVGVNDQSGNQVDDGNVNDVQVDVEDTVVVQLPPAAASIGGRQGMKKVVKFHTATNGGIVSLGGLPTGTAKIVVTRVHDGVTSVARRRVRVRPNTTKVIRVRLRARRA